MRIAIVNDELLKVVNVVKANSVDDVENGVVAEPWMAPKVKYTIEDGVRVQVITPPTPIPREELIVLCDEQRNRITDAEILAGFEWAGIQFPLTLENQNNFSQLYTLSKDELVVYPKKVWTGLSSTELNDAQEVKEFYLAGIAHVEACLDAGFTQKQAFRNMDYDTLEKWMSDNGNL